MLQDEIDRIRLTIEEAMVDAPASALLFKTGRVSLDELMQFLDIGSDVDNPESVLKSKADAGASTIASSIVSRMRSISSCSITHLQERR